MATVTDFDSASWDAVHKAMELGLLPDEVTPDQHVKHGRLMVELRKFIIERERGDQAARDAVASKSLSRGMDALHLATLFHETYERLAPDFGYETRPETRRFDIDSPNAKLMVAVCGVILEELRKE
jgi:hypothetical protein